MGHFCPVDMVKFIETIICNRSDIMQPSRNHDNFLIRPVLFRQNFPIFNHCNNVIIAAHSKLIRWLLASMIYFMPQIFENIFPHIFTSVEFHFVGQFIIKQHPPKSNFFQRVLTF